MDIKDLTDYQLKEHVTFCRKVMRENVSKKNAMYYMALNDKKKCLSELNRRNEN
ncbi:hypothetical protein P7D15_03050 [Bacillus cereus]|uniref:hypothetical protein n=1 Tax=Bacillus cereus group TaxID=86661 RepID=UPI0024056E00|nr:MULTISPECIES: hypothetical protein [Bacillus cereus group]MDF9599400.1 hypothetical protein [Bacillus cereus]MDG1589732.1 hypothetical protein [Bacillus cereus]